MEGKASLALSLMLAVSLLVPFAIYSAPKAKAQADPGSDPGPTFSTTVPPIKNSVSVRPTGTITRKSDNQPVWLWDLNIIDKDWLGGKSKPATVLKLKFTVKPNNLTPIIQSENENRFNESYRYCGRDITHSEIVDLCSDLAEMPVHASIGQLENSVTRPITPPTGGGTDWIAQGESNPITLTINLRDMQSPELAKNVPNLRGSWASVRLGSRSLLVTVTSKSDWDAGTHDNTAGVGGDLKISRWERMADMPKDAEMGHDLKYVEDGENIYVVRGYLTDDFWRYSIEEDNWYTAPADPPASIEEGGDAVYDGLDNLYVLQGNDTDNLFRYDISADSWEVFADVPASVRRGGSIEYDRANDNIYVLQGGDTDNLYCYDLDSGTWAQLSSAPGTIYYGGDMEKAGDNLYATRGYLVDDFFHHDIPTNSWAEDSDSGVQIGEGGDMAYLGDGENIYLQQGYRENAFFRFSIKDNAWYEIENTVEPPYGGGSLEYVETENSVYETPGDGDNSVYRYCLDNSAYANAEHTTAKENWNGVEKKWENLEADVSIPSGATLKANVQVSDNFANYGVQDNILVTLSDGLDNYDISELEAYDEVRIVTQLSKGTSDFGPQVHSYKLFGSDASLKLQSDRTENVDAYSADFVGELTAGNTTPDVKFQIREVGGTWENFGSITDASPDNYTASKGGLKDNTTYEWRFRGRSGTLENIGSIKTFTTDYPRVSFKSKSEVSTHSFKVTSSIENRGEPSLDVIVQYRKSGVATWNEKTVTEAAETKDYSTTLSGLDSDTEYKVRWKIVGSTYYSDTWVIKTKASGGGAPIAPVGPKPMSINVEVGRLKGGTFAKAKALELGGVATVRIKVTSKGKPVEGADVGAWWIPKPAQARTETIEISEVGGGAYQGSFTIPEDIAPGSYEVSAEATKSGYEKAYGYDTFSVVREAAKPGPLDKVIAWTRDHLPSAMLLLAAVFLFIALARE